MGAAIETQGAPSDPRFLNYEFFQEPMTTRVGVRFSFETRQVLLNMEKSAIG